MEFGLLAGRDGGEHSRLAFVDISEIVAMQDAFLLGAIPFDEVNVEVPLYVGDVLSCPSFTGESYHVQMLSSIVL